MGRKAVKKHDNRINMNTGFRWLISRPFVSICALFVVAIVVWRCVLPGITDSSDAVPSQADGAGNGYPYSTYPDGAHHFKPDIVNVKFDQLENGPGEDEAISVDFNLSYTITSDMLSSTNYIYYYLNEDRYDSSGAKIIIPDGGLPAGNILGNVNMGGVQVGTYRIEENGLIVIYFFDDFKTDLASSKSKTGTISFTADVKAADGNTSDDITLDFTGKDDSSGQMTISGFVYSNVSVEKSAPASLDEDGNALWTIKVKNPDGADLSGLKLSDSMFNNIIDGSFSYTNGTFTSGGDTADSYFTFGTTKETEITITYKTKVDLSDPNTVINGTKVNNEAVIKKDNDKELSRDSSSITIPSQVAISKKGAIEYNTDSDTITWTVTLDKKSGVDLTDYLVLDSKLDLSSGNVTISGLPQDSYEIITIEGKQYLKFKDNFKDDSKLEIVFTKKVDKSEGPADSEEYKNEVNIYSPNRDYSARADASVPQNEYSVSKSGYVLSGQPVIRWTASITSNYKDSTAPFDNMFITDDVINEILAKKDPADIKLKISADGVSDVGYTVVKDADGKVLGIRLADGFSDKITGDWEGKKKISISYETPANDDESAYTDKETDGSYTTKNTVGFGKDPGDTSKGTKDTTVTYVPRAEVHKSHSAAYLSDDRSQLIIPWQVTVNGEENSFIDFKLSDVLSGSVEGTSVANKFKEITKISVSSTISNRDLTSEQYTVTETADGFELKLNEAVLGEDFVRSINSITIRYTSTIDIDASISFGDVITFKNTAESLDKTASDEGSFTLVNPDKRIDKYSLYDKDSLSTDELVTKKIKINGIDTEVYLFKWAIELNENGDYTSYGYSKDVVLSDVLPDGFRLYEDAALADGFKLHYGKSDEGSDKVISSQEGVTYTTSVNGNQQTVSFNLKGWIFQYAPSNRAILYYVTYIPKSELDEKLVNQSAGISAENTVSDGEKSDSSEIFVTPGSNIDVPVKDGLIDKNSNPQNVGGSISYTIDFNPEAKDLLPGSDTIVLRDLLNFGSSYYTVVNGKKGDLVNGSPADLLNVSLQKIVFYEVDAEGNKKELTPKPLYTFENKPQETKSYDVPYSSIENIRTSYDSGMKTIKLDQVKDGSVIRLVVSGSSGTVIGNNGVKAFSGYANGQIDWGNFKEYSCDYKRLNESSYEITVIVETKNPGDTVDVYLEYGRNSWDPEGDIPDTVVSLEAESTSKLADAALTMTVPDGKHISIEYRYQALSDEVYSVPVSNSITAESRYGRHNDTNWTEFQAYDDSEAKVISDYVTIEKVDSSNSELKLNAGFIVARYNTDKWEYAQSINLVGEKYFITEWGTTKPSELFSTESVMNLHFGPRDTNNDGIADADLGDYLYYLEEVRVPEGYDTEFKDNRYFIYNTKLSQVTIPSNKKGPNGDVIRNSEISILSPGSVISVKNRKIISVSAEKTWTDGNSSHTEDIVSLELWSSTVKSLSATELPAGAIKVADAISVSPVSDGAGNLKWVYTWNNLPTSNALGQVLYYYIKEVNCKDGYSPVYTGNGLNTSGTVQIVNSKGLTITKAWLDRHGQTITDNSLIGVDEIKVYLYRSTTLAETRPDDAVLVKNTLSTDGSYSISKSNDWVLDITGLDIDDGTSKKYYYYVEEVSVDGYKSSIVDNGAPSDGMIRIKNTEETGYVLPETGGTGVKRYLMIGLSLMLMAGLGYIFMQVRLRPAGHLNAGNKNKNRREKV